MALLPLVLAVALTVNGALPGPGTEVRVSADSQKEGPGDWIILDGYVVIEYPGGSLQADHVEYNRKTGDVLADGNVVVESGPTVITGSQAEFNVEEQVGQIHDAVGWSEGDVQFRGDLVEKVSEDVYHMHHGELTSCQQPLPIWNIRWSKAVLHQGETAQMWNTVVRFKKAPAMYAPYVVFPVEDDRSTGFLMPQVSSSRRKGVSARVAYFWVISRSQDATFEVDWSEEEFSFSPQYRYIVNEQSGVSDFRAQWTRFKGEGRDSRELEAFFNHNQVFQSGYRWVVDLDYTSNINFTRTNSTNVNRATIESILSTTYLTRSWGPYSVTYRGEDRQWPDQDKVLRRLPEVELLQRSRQIGRSPVYWGYGGSLSRLHAEQSYRTPNTGVIYDADPTYERLDFRPEFRIPFSTLPWLDVQPVIALRETIYTAHLDPDEPQIVRDVLTRESGSFRLSMAGPKLERFYGLSRPAGSNKYQQLIEPTISWFYAPDVADTDLVLPFDAVDRIFNLANPRDPTRDIDSNRIDFGVTTRLLAKRIAAPGESEETSREVFSWRLSSAYLVNTFREISVGGRTERTRLNNLASDLRWRPTEKLNFTLRNTYDVVSDNLTSWNLIGDLNWGPETPLLSQERCRYRNCLRFTWSKNRTSALNTTAESLNLYGEWRLYGNRIRLTTDLRYDLLNSRVMNQRYVFHHLNQCMGTRISYSWNRFGERQVTFTISLKNVGDFIDFRSSGN